ncbi:hypothetical protein ACL6C3_10155 [Capilliphycus salinus ALCB114379]|uniref:hypothetical protein n=1 Tax=Capilliphycus salinus TaxID=2768948 RepID=UPI0039A4B158
MSEQSISNQTPNSPNVAEDAQEARTESQHYSGGDALLDAEIKQENTAEEAVNKPASTNFADTEEQS